MGAIFIFITILSLLFYVHVKDEKGYFMLPFISQWKECIKIIHELYIVTKTI